MPSQQTVRAVRWPPTSGAALLVLHREDWIPDFLTTINRVEKEQVGYARCAPGVAQTWLSDFAAALGGEDQRNENANRLKERLSTVEGRPGGCGIGEVIKPKAASNWR